MSRSRAGWRHYSGSVRAAERGNWTAVDFQLRQAADHARRDGDGLLLAMTFEAQGNRWEMAGYRGEALAQWQAALRLYDGRSQQAADHVRQLIRNWHEYPRVFVSYARKDARRAEELIAAMEGWGVEVFWDRHFIPGEDLSELIDWVMQYTGLYLVCWSRHYARRPFTRHELRAALAYLDEARQRGAAGQRVVCVRLDPQPRPPELKTEELWIDARRGTTPATLQSLRNALFGDLALKPRR
jgi:TIR domain-containing protein